MSWDVFGNGKTAVKGNIGKYLEGAGVSNNWANANPTLRAPGSGGPFAPLSVTRSWTDANRNFVPDCNLANPRRPEPRDDGQHRLVRRDLESELCAAVAGTVPVDQQFRSRTC